MNKGISLNIGIKSLSPEYRGGFKKLIGAENDARAMQSIADRNGFVSTLLLGRAATQKRVTDEIMAASRSLGEGDTMLITFSGHGSYIEDSTGKELSGNHARWCLYDTPIIDDDVTRLLNCFNDGVDIVLISDSCSTGTMIDRFDVEPIARHGATIKSISSVVATRVYSDFIERNGPVIIGCEQKERMAKVLLISASQDHSRGRKSAAYDAGSAQERYSKFTRALLEVWQNGALQGDYIKLFEGIEKIVSAPGHKPRPMHPNYVPYPTSSSEHWAGMIPFTLGKRWMPLAPPEGTLTSVLTVKVTVTIGEEERMGDGAIVGIMDSSRYFRSIRFIDESGIAIFDLEPGFYTLYGVMAYFPQETQSEDYYTITPIQNYSARKFEMPDGDTSLLLNIGGPGDKGEIRAVVKVDGLGRAGDIVTVEPGGFKKMTNSRGEVVFTGIQGGPYTATAHATRTCSSGEDPKTTMEELTGIMVPPSETVILPTFELTLCPP